MKKDNEQTFTDKSVYVFLMRLKNDGLITSNFGYVNGKKHYTYKATLKAYIPKEKRKDNGLHSVILRKLIKPFAENKISVVLDDNEQKEIRKLWSEQNE